MLNQEDFFKELGMEKWHFMYPWGEADCFKDSKGLFYRLDRTDAYIVVEVAGNEEEAKKNLFDDWDLYSRNGKTDEELLQEIKSDMLKVLS